MSKIAYEQPMKSAWERMKVILFQPFSLGKWMVMGFGAWLAMLTQQGGGGGNSFSNATNSCSEGVWDEYKFIIIAIVVGIVLISIPIALALSWVSARGNFIFLDNVRNNRAAIKEPWTRYKMQGNSYFLWNLAFGFVAFLILIPALGVCVGAAILMSANAFAGMLALVLGVVLFILLIIFLCYVSSFALNFVLPIMMRDDIGIRAAWAKFLPLLNENRGAFLLFGLMRYGLDIVFGIILLVLCLLTCCGALLLLIIPYISTVALLPAFVFFRQLGPEFLSQFGEEFTLSPESEFVEAVVGEGEDVLGIESGDVGAN